MLALRLLVAAFAEVVVPDAAVPVHEVEGRPVVVVEGAPDRVVVVDRHRVVDVTLLGREPDAVDLVLERELRRVDPDDDQPVVPVGLRPRPDVRLGAQPVDAGQRPEVDEDDVPAELVGTEGLAVEPGGRPLEGGQVQTDHAPWSTPRRPIPPVIVARRRLACGRDTDAAAGVRGGGPSGVGQGGQRRPRRVRRRDLAAHRPSCARSSATSCSSAPPPGWRSPPAACGWPAGPPRCSGLQDRTIREVSQAGSGRRLLRVAASSLFAEHAAPGLIELFTSRADDLDVELSASRRRPSSAPCCSRGRSTWRSGRCRPTPTPALDPHAVPQVPGRGRGRPGSPAGQGPGLDATSCASRPGCSAPSAAAEGGVVPQMLRRIHVPEDHQRIFQSDGRRAGGGQARQRRRAGGRRSSVAQDVAEGRLVKRRRARPAGRGRVERAHPARARSAPPAAAELARFVTHAAGHPGDAARLRA